MQLLLLLCIQLCEGLYTTFSKITNTTITSDGDDLVLVVVVVVLALVLVLVVVVVVVVVAAAIMVVTSTRISVTKKSKLHMTVIFSSTLIHLDIIIALQDVRHLTLTMKYRKME